MYLTHLRLVFSETWDGIPRPIPQFPNPVVPLVLFAWALMCVCITLYRQRNRSQAEEISA